MLQIETIKETKGTDLQQFKPIVHKLFILKILNVGLTIACFIITVKIMFNRILLPTKYKNIGND